MTADAIVARALAELDAVRDEMVGFAAELIRIPTVNPPGDRYPECAELIGRRLRALGFEVECLEPAGRPEHTTEHPRVNVLGTLPGRGGGTCLHLNGHFDVVPPGAGWTVDPFGGEIRDGRLFGRGSADMKAGLAAAIYAAAAVRGAGLDAGTLEVSATVDEESGGFAGVAHLAELGRLARERTDYVIIPEPFGPSRICTGHRGVYWFKVVAHGQTAHGSMPFLGRSAIDDLIVVLASVRAELEPTIGRRVTAMPVVPAAARRGSINVNSVRGGQADVGLSGALEALISGADRGAEDHEGDPAVPPLQTPCVADRAEAVFDRRFLIEESFDDVKAEIEALLEDAREGDPGRRYDLVDLLVVEPTMTPRGSPLVGALERAIRRIVGSEATLVASPGTYDHKHVARIAGVEHCVAYGPGELEQAHQPDESCAVDDILTAAKVMAAAAVDLLRP